MHNASIESMKDLRSKVRQRKPRAALPNSAGPNEEVIVSFLTSPEFKTELEKCLSSKANFDVDQLIRAAQTLIRTDTLLAQCDPRSFLGAVMQCAYMGLLIGYMEHVYVRAKPKDGLPMDAYTHEAQVIPGYKGLIALAVRDGDVRSVTVHTVTDKEIESQRFELAYEGARDVLIHRPLVLGERGRDVLVYCIVRMKNGEFQVEHLTESELNEMRDRAIANTAPADVSPWVTHLLTMWRAAVIRRALRYVPLGVSPEMATALAIDQAADGAKSTAPADAFATKFPNMRFDPPADTNASVIVMPGESTAKASPEHAAADGLDPDNPSAGSDG